MTRETKIGLLVGLAFIIVIGILLSDHMAGTSDPPSAKLDAAADNVRAGIATPAPNEPPVVVAGATGANAVPPASPQQAPLAVPSQPVPTQQDLHAPPQPQPTNAVVQVQQPQGTQRVEVGGPNVGGSRAPIVIRDTGAQQVARGPVQVEVQNPPQPEPVDAPVTVLPEGANDNTAIADNQQPQQPAPTRRDANGKWEWTREMGEEVVTLGGGNEPAGNGKSRNPANAPPAGTNPKSGGPFEYKAEQGDTLSKLAGKYLGGNTKTNRELIVRANPSLKDNPDKIVVGHTYVIPAPPAQPQPAPSAPVVLVEQRQTKPTDRMPTAPQQQQPQSRRQVADAALPAGQAWYTVRENDSLWKIASEQLGSGNAAEKIKELNQDVLKGDTIVPGMRLRLPAKPLASAN